MRDTGKLLHDNGINFFSPSYFSLSLHILVEREKAVVPQLSLKNAESPAKITQLFRSIILRRNFYSRSFSYFLAKKPLIFFDHFDFFDEVDLDELSSTADGTSTT